jgi:hypothetical protein
MPKNSIGYILDIYERCSGQMINKEKSSIVFSKNTKKQNKENVKTILSISKEGHSGRYLGLPVYIGKSKSKTFSYLEERIWRCIQGWKEKLLSIAGKEILIKAVAQAIPVYAMACFDLKKGFCDQLSAMISKYWWSHGKRKWHALGELGKNDIFQKRMADWDLEIQITLI